MADKANGKGKQAHPLIDSIQLKAVDDLRQRDVVAWNNAYLARGLRQSMAAERQASLEAAIEAGWIVNPETRYEDVTTPDGKTERRYYFNGVQVDDMRAYEVAYYGQRCNLLFEETMNVPNV